MVDFFVQGASAGGLFYGLWEMGNGKLRGPAITCIAELCATYVGVSHHVWSLTLIGVGLTFVQGRNFIKWSQEGRKF